MLPKLCHLDNDLEIIIIIQYIYCVVHMTYIPYLGTFFFSRYPSVALAVIYIYKYVYITHKEPGCKASWEKRFKLETDIPWREIGRNIAHGIGTKKDEHLVQKHTTQSHVDVPTRNNHNHQNNTMHLVRTKP